MQNAYASEHPLSALRAPFAIGFCSSRSYGPLLIHPSVTASKCARNTDSDKAGVVLHVMQVDIGFAAFCLLMNMIMMRNPLTRSNMFSTIAWTTRLVRLSFTFTNYSW